MNPKQYMGASMQGFDNVAQAPRQEDVFDSLRRCQQRFHEACNRFQQAQIERAAAQKELESASQEASQVITNALNDPTQPQAQCGIPANGHY